MQENEENNALHEAPTTSYSTGVQQWRISGGGDDAADASAREALRQEIARLANAADHLQSSNEQIREALLADPGDQDFKDALGENIGVIAKYRARIEAMQRQLDATGGHDADFSGSGDGAGAGRPPLGDAIIGATPTPDRTIMMAGEARGPRDSAARTDDGPRFMETD